MADLLVEQKASSLDTSDKLQGYSRVVIKTGEVDDDGNDIAYISGNTTGRTLEINNPWGNQTIADSILAKIQGWAYQPMDAGAISLNPAFEIGDSVVVDDVYSGIYSAKLRFSHLFTADIQAPVDKEINHEYEYEDSQERVYTRKLNNVVARLNFFADSIEAKVDKNGGGSEFGWRLTEIAWTVFNESGNLFTINKDGAYVKGEIQASKGKIGGFNIGQKGIYNGISSYGGQETTGVYIGNDGIQLGQKFKVDSQGNLTATNGTFNGNVYAKNILSGGNYGTLSGSAITPSSLGVGQLTSGVNTSLGFADFSNRVFNERARVKYMDAQYLYNTIAAYLTQVVINDSFRYKADNTDAWVHWKSKQVVTDVGQTQNFYLFMDIDGNIQKCLLYNGTNVTCDKETIYYLGR